VNRRPLLRLPLRLTALLALAALAVACGSGDSKKETKATAAPQSTQAAAVATQAAATQAAAPKGDDPAELVMAFVPSRDVSAIQLQADKIAAYLSKDLNKNVKSVTLTSYAAVSQALTNKKADIAWVGPLDYLISHEQNGSYPITCSVRGGNRGYKAFIIAKTDSGINDVKDLKGKTFAFGDVVSASSSLVPKAAIKNAGLDPAKDLKSVNIPNQSAIAISVYEGKADAGAIYDDARTNKEVKDKYPDILEKTKVIFTSELIPCDPQIVRKGLDETLVSRIQASLLKLSEDTEGKVWLKDLFTIDSLSKASDTDYDGLRNIVKLVQPDLLKGYPTPTPTATP
jgi:phosphonate transport system substrate-binding protein